jgi:hypothetical protein
MKDDPCASRNLLQKEKLYRKGMDNKIRTETWPAKDCAKSGIWTRRQEYRDRILYPLLAPFFAG